MTLKTTVKIILDILMAAVLALMFNKMAVAGLGFHEIGGLILGLAFLFHKFLNWNWIVKVTGHLFSKKLNTRTRIGYMVDVLLLAGMAVILITGLEISKIVVPAFGTRITVFGHLTNAKMLHISASYLTLVLTGIHVGLHWKWIMSKMAPMFGRPAFRKIPGRVATVVAVVVIALGGWQTVSTSLPQRVGSLFTLSQAQGFEGQRPDSERRQGNSDQASGSMAAPAAGDQKGQRPEGKGRPEGGDRSAGMPGKPDGMHGAAGEGSGTLGTLCAYLSVMAFFAGTVYYIDEFFRRRNQKSLKTA